MIDPSCPTLHSPLSLVALIASILVLILIQSDNEEGTEAGSLLEPGLDKRIAAHCRALRDRVRGLPLLALARRACTHVAKSLTKLFCEVASESVTVSLKYGLVAVVIVALTALAIKGAGRKKKRPPKRRTRRAADD
jgi:hypothetical protein